ncbi:MAG: hypothetical protein IJV40_06845 [Oscillospiraceae bacterium]|nr:hypothetical protein [Oscillospiraceae bacterium]
MYSDRPMKQKSWILWLLLILLAAAVLLMFSGRGRDLSDSNAVAIREAVQRGALQCYVVEGAYPPNLEYLEDNYGLHVNTADFYVTYEAFASNLPPTVRVTRK